LWYQRIESTGWSKEKKQEEMNVELIAPKQLKDAQALIDQVRIQPYPYDELDAPHLFWWWVYVYICLRATHSSGWNKGGWGGSHAAHREGLYDLLWGLFKTRKQETLILTII
jgi:hypothetical protein